MSPRASAGGEISTAGIPLYVSDTVVVSGTEMLDPGGIACTLLLAFLRVEVDILELQF